MIRLELGNSVTNLTGADESRSSHRPNFAANVFTNRSVPAYLSVSSPHIASKFVAYLSDFQAIMQQY